VPKRRATNIPDFSDGWLADPAYSGRMTATLPVIEIRTAEELVTPVASAIRQMAAQAEASRRLPDELMATLKEAGLFSIYTPVQFGGLDLPLPRALEVVEDVARHDGSTGWVVALGVANSVFTGALSAASAERVLGTGPVLIAGAPAFGVRATRVEGGYRVTGRWSYNSGAPNADWIAAPAPIFDGDAPRMTPAGPEMVMFFVRPTDVEIIDIWYVTGLRASGTQDLYVEDLFVPDEMTGGFSMPAGPHALRDSPITRIPFLTLFGLVQSPPVCLGLARRAIEEFKQIAHSKQDMFGARLSDKVQAQVGLARAEALVRSARSYWNAEVDRAWNAAVENRPLSVEDRVGLRIASLVAAEQSVAAADLLYRLAGSSAIFQSSALERCWRDIHTAEQHMQVQDSRWETAGRVLLGLDAGSPLL
jgi:alkylation response protein AidB-like acyl-CoA dehydrogenase